MEQKRYYNDYGSWIRGVFPEFRVQKIGIDAGFSCPNRDGLIGTGGCVYCDNSSFSPSYCGGRKSIAEQIRDGKEFFQRKYPSMRYLAYFQSFTNTYAPLHRLQALYEEALGCDDVVGIVIGTRPDMMPTEVLDYLETLSRQTFVVVEYGIESVFDETLQRINRGHTFGQARETIEATAARGITVGGHVILGLPGEDEEMMIKQAEIISDTSLRILKLHQMQVLRGTKLADMYASEPFRTFSVDEYIHLIARYIQHLREDIIIERFTSQSPPQQLIAPQWGLRNHEFTAKLLMHLHETDAWQGKMANSNKP